MTVEGWWGDYAPAKKDEGATPKGQTQAPVAPAPAHVKSGTMITAPKIKFSKRR